MTRGSVTGQVKALSMIVAMENFIPDRRAVSSRRRNPPLRPPTANLCRPHGFAGSRPSNHRPAAKPCPGRRFACLSRQCRRACPSPSPLPARRQRRLRTLAPASPPSPTALAPRKPPNLMSPCFASVPDMRVPFSIKKNPFARPR